MVAADLALTGMLHFDGLVDSADGLLPPLDREPAPGGDGRPGGRRLRRRRRRSSCCCCGGRRSPRSTPSPVLLAALWCASRPAMAVVARTVPYARPSGLATAFLEPGRGRLPVAGHRCSAPVLAAPRPAATRSSAWPSSGWRPPAVVALAVRRLGGFTGDVLGAAGMVGETAGLLAAAARW